MSGRMKAWTGHPTVDVIKDECEIEDRILIAKVAVYGGATRFRDDELLIRGQIAHDDIEGAALVVVHAGILDGDERDLSSCGRRAGE